MSDEKREGLKDAISRAIQAYAEHVYSDQDGVYVQGWAIGLEWTSIELEQANSGGLLTIAPTGQLLTVSRGCGEYVADVYSNKPAD